MAATSTRANVTLERLRIAGVIAAFVLASTVGSNAQDRLGILQVCLVTAIAGLTAMEGLFFADGAAQLSGYGAGNPYQRQSAMNNLALTVVSLVVFFAGWGVYAALAVMLVLLVFLTLSAINHAYAGFKVQNRNLRTFTRLRLLWRYWPLRFRTSCARWHRRLDNPRTFPCC